MIFLEVPTIEDAEAISAVHRKSWHDTYDGILPPEKIEEMLLHSEPAQIEHFREVARGNRPEHLLLIAKSQGEIVGFCDMRSNGRRAEIKAIYILSEHQRRGIGTKMMHSFRDWSRNPEGVTVDVLLENRPAVRFFEKHGFRAEQDIESVGGIKILTLVSDQ